MRPGWSQRRPQHPPGGQRCAQRRWCSPKKRNRPSLARTHHFSRPRLSGPVLLLKPFAGHPKRPPWFRAVPEWSAPWRFVVRRVLQARSFQVVSSRGSALAPRFRFLGVCGAVCCPLAVGSVGRLCGTPRARFFRTLPIPIPPHSNRGDTDLSKVVDFEFKEDDLADPLTIPLDFPLPPIKKDTNFTRP